MVAGSGGKKAHRHGGPVALASAAVAWMSCERRAQVTFVPGTVASPSARHPHRRASFDGASSRATLPHARISSRFAGLLRPGVAALVAAGATAAAACKVTRRAAAGDYKKSTVAELKVLLKERGLPVSGVKAELIARLEGNDAGADAGGDSAKKKTKGRSVAMPAEEEKAEEPEAKAEGGDEKKKEEEPAPYGHRFPDGPAPPHGVPLIDPHEGKPETIVDEDGRTRFLCLDGQYRRGDPDSIEMDTENFTNWLSEWVVAARTGQLEGKPQKTFLPKEPANPGNPTGTMTHAGPIMRSAEVLTKLEPGPDGLPRWEYQEK